MRIVVVNNFFPPRVGGSSHLSESLAKAYAALGHEVLVLTAAYADAPAREERDGLTIIRMPSVALPKTRFAVSFDISFATRPGLARSIARILDDFRPDVIHQHGQFFDLTWATGKYARKRDIPVLLSVHTRLENPTALYSGIFRMLDATMVAPVLRRYRPRIVVMDVLMDEYIKDRYRNRYSGLDYIPVGVDPTWTRGGDANLAREILGVTAEAPLILSLGHIIPLRDRVKVVEALPTVLEEFPDAKLVVVGQVYYDEFLKRADELGVAEAIISTGAVPKSQVPNFLAAASVETHEQGIGLGTATLEAMAAGVPVVAAARADNFPTIALVDREHLYLTPIDDAQALSRALVDVLRDPAAAREVGLRGQIVASENFALDVVVRQHIEVLTSMCARG